MTRSPTPQRPTEAAFLQSAKKKSKSSSTAKAAAPKGVNYGEMYEDMCARADKNPQIKVHINKYLEHLKKNKKIITKKTSTGRMHDVYDCQSSKKFQDDLRIVLPKSKDFEKGKDGQGLQSMFKAQGFDREKVTLTWLTAYAAGVRVDKSKEGWQNFECSHLCCDYDENGKRLQGFRCVDGKCLVFESKSENQSRANKACRSTCHCGCGTICAANKIHDPPCH